MKWFERFWDEEEPERPPPPIMAQEPKRKRYQGKSIQDTSDGVAIQEEGERLPNVAGRHREISESAKPHSQKTGAGASDCGDDGSGVADSTDESSDRSGSEQSSENVGVDEKNDDLLSDIGREEGSEAAVGLSLVFPKKDRRGGERRRVPGGNPWKQYDITLRTVAVQEAKTLFLRRARLRAQVSMRGGLGWGVRLKRESHLK